MCKIRLTLFFFLAILIETSSQEFIWDAGYHGFFDNREYFNPYSQAQSIFGSRIFGSAGIRIDEHNDIQAGIDYMFEFGSKATTKNLNPILFYHHKNSTYEFFMGAFPRHELINLPLVLLSDTIQYYRPNVEGAFLSISKSWGSQNVWLDWTSRQTLEDHESFAFGVMGTVNKGIVFAKYNILMYHFAGTLEGPHNIRDNGGIVAIAGIDLSQYTRLDSLSISSGIVHSYDRQRTQYDLTYSTGSLSEMYGQYKSIGLRSTMYFGDSQTLLLGDEMYKSPIYNRTDIILNFLRKGRIKGFFEFSLHFIPGNTDFSQKCSVYVNINSTNKKKAEPSFY